MMKKLLSLLAVAGMLAVGQVKADIIYAPSGSQTCGMIPIGTCVYRWTQSGWAQLCCKALPSPAQECPFVDNVLYLGNVESGAPNCYCPASKDDREVVKWTVNDGLFCSWKNYKD